MSSRDLEPHNRKIVNRLQSFTFSAWSVTKTLTAMGERQFLVSLWDKLQAVLVIFSRDDTIKAIVRPTKIR